MEWISVEDSLPNNNQWIMMRMRRAVVKYGKYVDRGFYIRTDTGFVPATDIGHWAPAPNIKV
jgi:hypothetical protein